MEMLSTIRIGSRVYLKNGIAGEPGIVMSFERKGKVLVEWADIPEIGRCTVHPVDSLVVDEAFKVEQISFGYDKI